LQKGGIKTIADYALLYDGQWKKAAPDGVLPGMLSNYTSDLLFSMERLSVNPYILRRAKREDPSLPFKVDDATVQKVTKTKATFASLLSSGSLFYVDHSYQKAYERVDTRYTAYCSALFYIHPISRDFLPLAIKTNIGSDLVYTPLDSPDDWLLAKIMFNVNDFFWSQFAHVGNTHAVGEIAYQACEWHLGGNPISMLTETLQAAIRTLSINHPVRVVLARSTFPRTFSPSVQLTKMQSCSKSSRFAPLASWPCSLLAVSLTETLPSVGSVRPL
jgi:hypothetical protein